MCSVHVCVGTSVSMHAVTDMIGSAQLHRLSSQIQTITEHSGTDLGNQSYFSRHSGVINLGCYGDGVFVICGYMGCLVYDRLMEFW